MSGGIEGCQGCRGCQGCIRGLTGSVGTEEPVGVYVASGASRGVGDVRDQEV